VEDQALKKELKDWNRKIFYDLKTMKKKIIYSDILIVVDNFDLILLEINNIIKSKFIIKLYKNY